MSPTVFIPFAEQSGQIIELGRWVLQKASSDRHRWQRERPEAIGISVNVSAYQFMTTGFAATVEEALESDSTDPGLLTLEVTERVFLRDEERALVVLDELKAIGVKLALDDFGTGYSSLGYLTSLPIDVLKIDRTFIAKLSAVPGSQAVVTAIIGLAHSLGLTVVAEGVETARQHDEVTRLGADSCQGFYFARPMSAARLDTLIHSQADGTNPLLPSTAIVHHPGPEA